MATVREYFDTDFSYTLRVHGAIDSQESNAELAILYDFSGYHAFLAVYFGDPKLTVADYLSFLSTLKHGETRITFGGSITLPSTREFPGEIEAHNVPGFLKVLARFHGDPTWISVSELQTSNPARVFIYAEADISSDDILYLKREGLKMGHEVQFRSQEHARKRSANEAPLAFISYDSRDRNIAKEIATQLVSMRCPVWYDQFSLKVGDNLRDTIEKGLKECEKCILLLTPHFISNAGWTKREFDSIFTREILEQKRLVLPVWHGVTTHEIYQYSPGLLNVKGVDWSSLGRDEVCQQLLRSIMQ